MLSQSELAHNDRAYTRLPEATPRRTAPTWVRTTTDPPGDTQTLLVLPSAFH